MQPSAQPNYYEILQIQPYANPALITAAYRILSKLYHPDTAKEEANIEKFRVLQQAYETLSDPQKRHEYDRELRSRMAYSNQTGWRDQDFSWGNNGNGWNEPSTDDERYKISPEDLEYFNNLYNNYAPPGHSQRRTILIGIYLILMFGAVIFGFLGFVAMFSVSLDDRATAPVYFILGGMLLIGAQIEAYFS